MCDPGRGTECWQNRRCVQRKWEKTKQNRRGNVYRRLMGCGDFKEHLKIDLLLHKSHFKQVANE